MVQTTEHHVLGFLVVWFIVKLVEKGTIILYSIKAHIVVECLTPALCFVEVDKARITGLRNAYQLSSPFPDLLECEQGASLQAHVLAGMQQLLRQLVH